MTNSLVIDVNAPNTSTMSVDITSPDLLSVEIPVVSGFSVDMTPTPTMTIDIVSGGVKGDKGDPGGQDVEYMTSMIIAAHKAVSLNKDNKLVYTDINDRFLCQTFIGVTLSAGDAESLVTVRTFGKVADVSLNFGIAQNIFVTTQGTLVAIKPEASRYFCIGTSYDINSFYLTVPLLWEEEL